MPSETEIREVVRRVVAGMASSGGPAASGSAMEAPRSRGTAASAGGRPIAVGADHGGYPLKEKIGFRLRERGYEVTESGIEMDGEPLPDRGYTHGK